MKNFLTESLNPIVHPNKEAISPIKAVNIPITKIETKNVSHPLI